MPTNIQLKDTLNGGTFVFVRNDYPLDEGIYTELYCAFFTTKSPNWLGDDAFEVDTPPVNSKTENAVHKYNTEANKSLILKAVQDDLTRFTNKNPEILIKSVNLVFWKNGSLRINVEIEGNSNSYDFIVKKTLDSLENVDYEIVTL
jgi:hypothetical protein